MMVFTATAATTAFFSIASSVGAAKSMSEIVIVDICVLLAVLPLQVTRMSFGQIYQGTPIKYNASLTSRAAGLNAVIIWASIIRVGQLTALAAAAGGYLALSFSKRPPWAASKEMSLQCSTADATQCRADPDCLLLLDGSCDIDYYILARKSWDLVMSGSVDEDVNFNWKFFIFVIVVLTISVVLIYEGLDQMALYSAIFIFSCAYLLFVTAIRAMTMSPDAVEGFVTAKPKDMMDPAHLKELVQASLLKFGAVSAVLPGLASFTRIGENILASPLWVNLTALLISLASSVVGAACQRREQEVIRSVSYHSIAAGLFTLYPVALTYGRPYSSSIRCIYFFSSLFALAIISVTVDIFLISHMICECRLERFLSYPIRLANFRFWRQERSSPHPHTPSEYNKKLYTGGGIMVFIVLLVMGISSIRPNTFGLKFLTFGQIYFRNIYTYATAAEYMVIRKSFPVSVQRKAVGTWQLYGYHSIVIFSVILSSLISYFAGRSYIISLIVLVPVAIITASLITLTIKPEDENDKPMTFKDKLWWITVGDIEPFRVRCNQIIGTIFVSIPFVYSILFNYFTPWLLYSVMFMDIVGYKLSFGIAGVFVNLIPLYILFGGAVLPKFLNCFLIESERRVKLIDIPRKPRRQQGPFKRSPQRFYEELRNSGKVWSLAFRKTPRTHQ
eukprot:GHVO01027548.1.p1 GENE.GHVO01027548.1~~GHVO01027548.1.p1  ORF type:complete len:674 (+),score=62.14 GHVO01027548.1:240-2261(+)